MGLSISSYKTPLAGSLGFGNNRANKSNEHSPAQEFISMSTTITESPPVRERATGCGAPEGVNGAAMWNISESGDLSMRWSYMTPRRIA